MIGSLDITRREVTIIGAGISGMLMAYALDHQGYNVTLIARETWCAAPGRMLFGNYTGQVSLRAMIESAAALSEHTQSSVA